MPNAPRGLSALALSALTLATGGCASVSTFYNNLVGNTNQNQQVTPDQFVQRRTTNNAPLSAVDRSGQLSVDNPRLTPSQESATGSPPPPTPSPDAKREETGISSAVQQAIRPPGEDAAIVGPASATRPASTQPETPEGPSVSNGSYMTLGGVLAVVNSTPIFANKVLQLLGPTLRIDARQYDREHFTIDARDKIERQVGELVRDELDYAAAERSLDPSDRNLVEALTTAYRRQLLTESGGSEQVARRKATANGDDFDELIRQRYRTYMIQLYYQKKFGPRVQVGAADMRRYYQQHLQDKEFTTHGEATIDLVKIDPAQIGGSDPVKDRQLAFQEAKDCRDRAASGASFETLFKEYNKDAALRSITKDTGRWPQPIQHGAFNISEVEDAVWKLQPGHVSDVINVHGVLYIVKVESKTEDNVRPFEDEDVQDQIALKLRTDQYRQFREQEQEKLLEQATVSTNPQMLDTAVDMALQNYPVWAAK